MALEKQIQELDTLITSLEDESIDLDTAVDTYSKALHLAKDTYHSLNKVQEHFSVLKKEQDEFIETTVAYTEGDLS